MVSARRILCAGLLAGALGVGVAEAQPKASEAGAGATGAGTEARTETGTAAGAESAAGTESAAQSGTGAGAGATPAPPTKGPQRSASEARRRQTWQGQARGQGHGQVWAAQPAAAPVPVVRGNAGAPFGLGFTLERRWYADAGYDVFAGDDVSSRVGLWLSYDVLSLEPDVIVAAELGFSSESDESDNLLGGQLDSQLEAYSPHAGAQIRWVLSAWMQPHLRLNAGVTIWETQLRVQGTEFANDGVAPFGSATAGLLVRTPTRMFENSRGRLASLGFGVLLEGGYGVEAPWTMDVERPGPDGNDIELAESSLGDLGRSGPFVRASLVGRY